MSNWISAFEHIPEEDELSKGESVVVLVYTDDGYMGSGFIEKYSFCNHWVSNEREPIEGVTHWMPLPEPPQED